MLCTILCGTRSCKDHRCHLVLIQSWHNVVDLVVVLLATAASIASNVILDCIGRELDASLFQEESGKWEKVDPNLCHIKGKP